jgi:hypothetical protein
MIRHRYPAEIVAEKGKAALQSSNTSTAPRQGSATTGKAHVVVGKQGSAIPGQTNTAASKSNTQKGKGKATQDTGKPKEKKLITAGGKLDHLGKALRKKEEEPPTDPKLVYPDEIDKVMDPTRQERLISSNFLRITKIPDTLYVYSLDFWRNDAQGNRFAYNKRGEIESAFEASTYNGEDGEARLQDTNFGQKLDLRALQWATNYKKLWTTAPVPNPGQDLGPFLYDPPGRKRIRHLYMTVGEQRKLDKINHKFSTSPAHKLADETRALNAIITRSVKMKDKESKSITQVGANKFYLKGGYEQIKRSLFVKRGYFSSVRPSKNGPLLNVNIATSAFLPAMPVSEFIQQVGKDYAENFLEGACCGLPTRERNTKEVSNSIRKSIAKSNFNISVSLAVGKSFTRTVHPLERRC